jgi:flagellar biogenesis protein FliO
MWENNSKAFRTFFLFHHELMKQSVSHEAKRAPIRWRVVTRVVLAVCALAFVAFIAWYVVAIVIPRQQHARQQREFDEIELSILSSRMLRVETILHIR